MLGFLLLSLPNGDITFYTGRGFNPALLRTSFLLQLSRRLSLGVTASAFHVCTDYPGWDESPRY